MKEIAKRFGRVSSDSFRLDIARDMSGTFGSTMALAQRFFSSRIAFRAIQRTAGTFGWAEAARAEAAVVDAVRSRSHRSCDYRNFLSLTAWQEITSVAFWCSDTLLFYETLKTEISSGALQPREKKNL